MNPSKSCLSAGRFEVAVLNDAERPVHERGERNEGLKPPESDS
jgi:hypothetical protein